MTVLYEVKTGHTKEVLKAFAKFYNEIGKNNKKIMFRYGIAAVCFLMLPRALKLSGIYPAICWGASLFFLKRDLLFIICEYTVTVFRHPRRGH